VAAGRRPLRARAAARVCCLCLAFGVAAGVVPAVSWADPVPCDEVDTNCQAISDRLTQAANEAHRDMWVLIGAVVSAALVPVGLRALGK